MNRFLLTLNTNYSCFTYLTVVKIFKLPILKFSPEVTSFITNQAKLWVIVYFEPRAKSVVLQARDRLKVWFCKLEILFQVRLGLGGCV